MLSHSKEPHNLTNEHFSLTTVLFTDTKAFRNSTSLYPFFTAKREKRTTFSEIFSAALASLVVHVD